MKKTVWTCGIIAGLIVTLWMFYHMINPGPILDTGSGMVFGFATMILAFSLIFVAVKNYRDKHNGGTITFGKAFVIGLYVTLIASTIYVLVWLVDFYNFNPDFIDHYTAIQIEELRKSDKSESDIAAEIQKMEQMAVSYKTNPLVVILWTYLEIFPVGLLISLIAALVLKRKSSAAVQEISHS